MTQLAQSYLHVKPSGDITFSARELHDFLRSYSARTVADIYQQRLQIDVRVEEGSFKFWVSVAGGLFAAIAAYPDFKKGIAELAHDAIEFGQLINDGIAHHMSIPPKAIYRRERRRKAPGSVFRLILRKEELESKIKVMSKKKRKETLRKWRKDAERVLAQLDREEDRKIVYASLQSDMLHLPSLSTMTSDLPALPVPHVRQIASGMGVSLTGSDISTFPLQFSFEFDPTNGDLF